MQLLSICGPLLARAAALRLIDNLLRNCPPGGAKLAPATAAATSMRPYPWRSVRLWPAIPATLSAVWAMMRIMSLGDRSGDCCSSKAARPAVIGEAKEVPE